MIAFQKLLDFLDQLDACSIFFKLERHRSETIMVRVDVPGERWEVEFFADGHIEVEVFRAFDDELQGEESLERLFAEHSDRSQSSD